MEGRRLAALVRHGEYEQPAGVPSALLPHPLTERGREQARDAARELAEAAREQGLRIDPVVDTSRQLRAWETGSLIAAGLSEILGETFGVSEFMELSERSLGSAANLTVAEIERIVARDPRYEALPPRWKSKAAFKLPLQGAECLLEAGQRVAGHLRARLTAPDTLKVFVGHGAAFRFAAVDLGLFTTEEAEAHSMFHCQPVVLERRGDAWTHAFGDWKVRAERVAASTSGGD